MSTLEEQKMLVELETMPFIVGPAENGSGRKTQEFDNFSEPKRPDSGASGMVLRKNGISIVVNACLLAFQLGVITVFMVFAVEHVIEIYEFIAKSPPPFSKTVMILMYFVPQMGLNFIGHMKLITILCLCGNVIIFAAIVLITKELMVHDWYPSWELNSVTGIEGISLAAGALIYSFEGQAMVLPLENSLKYPKDMTGISGVLSTAMNLVTVLYAFLGFFGYVTFGPKVQGSLTLNLPNSVLTVSIKGLLVLKIFFGSAIQLFVIVQMLLPSLRQRFSEERVWLHRLLPYGLRFVLMLISLCLALVVPNLMQIIPLVGITSGLLISLILPSFLDCMVFLPVFKKRGEMKQFYQKLTINVCLFVLGWLFLGSGVYSSIDDIINNDV
uniref:Aa_trans domain-containing protein n=1 Tax=Caenorhabditis japonica TaxID=281687 RepID=A0A8R1HY68_CAEJA